jgi:glycosyltransferase involved in cell wall biosynthesis
VKVLLLHQHFNTPQKGGPLRSYFLVRALSDFGIRPVVITTHNKAKYHVEIVEGLEVHYLPVTYDNSFGFYKRGKAFVEFMIRAISLARKFKDAALCYAISVPLTVGVAAMVIKSLYKIPYIFEVGDLWPDAPIEMGFIRNNLLKKTLYRIERSIYENAHAIVALSVPIQQNIQRKVSNTKVYVIENMSDTMFLRPERKDVKNEKKFGVEGKFVVSYIGAIGYANGLEHFLACAVESKRADLPVHFILCGDGAMVTKLKQTASTLELQNISFVPFQNRQGVRELLNVTDATFISYKPIPILETGSPHKYFDGLAAGKLIVVNFGGWIKEEIHETQCGIFVDPGSPPDFVQKMRSFLADASLLKKFQANSRSLAEKKYARTLLSKKFLPIIDIVKTPETAA